MTDYDGHISIITTEAAAGNGQRIDVALRFEATTAFWLHLRYLVEEISQWHNGAQLLQLDTNTRYMVGGHIVRQQWDDFQAARDGLEGYRIEGKRPAEFRSQYPRFAQHWDPAAFGLDWLGDYAPAQPKRRPDLDLQRLPQSSSVQSPFALAFYWVRFLHPGVQSAQVFLPGFKADKLADLLITPVPTARGRLWRAELHHPYLSATPPSFATARISPDGHLQVLTFALHGPAGSGSGSLHQTGCTGAASR